MCILLYVKLIWCSGFPEIYAWLEERVGSVCHGYMCILLSMKLIWCSCVPGIYAWMEEGVGSVCHGYMCILLYVKLIQCSGVPKIYDWLLRGSRCGRAVLTLAQLARGPLWCMEREIERERQNLSCTHHLNICPRYLCIVLYVKLIQCNGLPEISAQLDRSKYGLYSSSENLS